MRVDFGGINALCERQSLVPTCVTEYLTTAVLVEELTISHSPVCRFMRARTRPRSIKICADAAGAGHMASSTITPANMEMAVTRLRIIFMGTRGQARSPAEPTLD